MFLKARGEKKEKEKKRLCASQGKVGAHKQTRSNDSTPTQQVGKHDIG
jgi:hypothetical protein